MGSSGAQGIGWGIMATIFNCIELFFQMNAMLSLENDPSQVILFGCIKNPYPSDAWQHKMRSLVTTLFAIIASISFPIFSYKVLAEKNEPLAVAICVLAFIGPVWSNIKPADEGIGIPLEKLVGYILNYVGAHIPVSNIPDNIKRCWHKWFGNPYSAIP
jgi:hypothetical protein